MSDSVLTRILAHKQIEVARQQAKVPLAQLHARLAAAPAVRDFAAALHHPGRVALIAEVKKASPSRGVLLEAFNHLELAQTYSQNGASAISVLTDTRFFQGSLKFLEGIRQLPITTPVLRKDFLLDPYQLYEARAYGADAVLLIVAALDDATLQQLLRLTHTLGMHALVEVHTRTEFERAIAAGATVIGVNNRDLHTFETDLDITEQIAARLHRDANHRPLLVSESGIFTAADVLRLQQCGVDAVLVGEALVTAPDIGAKVRELTQIGLPT